MPLRIGPLLIFTRDELARRDLTLLEALAEGDKTEAARNEAIIRRQHDLLTATEAERDLAVARYKEANEAVGEQVAEVARLQAILRHPVSQPPPEEAA